MGNLKEWVEVGVIDEGVAELSAMEGPGPVDEGVVELSELEGPNPLHELRVYDGVCGSLRSHEQT